MKNLTQEKQIIELIRAGKANIEAVKACYKTIKRLV